MIHTRKVSVSSRVLETEGIQYASFWIPGQGSIFSCERRAFRKLERLPNPTEVTCAKRGEEARLLVSERGELHTFTESGTPVSFTSVLFSEELSENLLSLSQFTDQGATFSGNRKFLEIRDGRRNEVILRAKYERPFWYADLEIRSDCRTNPQAYLTDVVDQEMAIRPDLEQAREVAIPPEPVMSESTPSDT